MKIIAVATICSAIAMALGLSVYWYAGEPISDAKIDQLQYCSSKESVRKLLGPPTSTYYDVNGKEYWEYHGKFLGIQTVLHLDVVFTNDAFYTWAKMD
jgi:outer membrane protein assembly factor BamE (lipoprotein component of BamABCDE complex)